MRAPATLLLLTVAAGCGADEPPTEAEHRVLELGDTRQVIPGPALPTETPSQTSNNNLDVVVHEGRLFLAFRTAPSHFASTETRLYVVSAADQDVPEWRFEAAVHRNTDLREPRFLSHGGRLFLYFAVLGPSRVDFEPQGAMVMEYQGAGDWTEPEWFGDDSFIPWRARVIAGSPFMIGYVGGENVYDFDGDPIQVHLLTGTDGRTWEPVIEGQPEVLEGGVSETDFVLLDDGALIAVGRNEAGDDLGFGSKICRAEPGALGSWRCVADPRKYDSPLMFRHGSEVYLVGRRNVTETGHYDLDRSDLEPADRALNYQLDYWGHPKRCAIWQVDPDALAVTHLVDLPSRGDTCFPSIIQRSDHEFDLYNYTSPTDGPDVSWIDGQNGPTRIVVTRVRFVPESS